MSTTYYLYGELNQTVGPSVTYTAGTSATTQTTVDNSARTISCELTHVPAGLIQDPNKTLWKRSSITTLPGTPSTDYFYYYHGSDEYTTYAWGFATNGAGFNGDGTLLNTTNTFNGEVWTLDAQVGTYYLGTDNTRHAQQLGSSTKWYTSIIMHTSSTFTNLSSVIVNACGATHTPGTIDMTVQAFVGSGSTWTALSAAQDVGINTTGTNTLTFANSSGITSGQIKLVFTQTLASGVTAGKAFYLGGITIKGIVTNPPTIRFIDETGSWHTVNTDAITQVYVDSNFAHSLEQINGASSYPDVTYGSGEIRVKDKNGSILSSSITVPFARSAGNTIYAHKAQYDVNEKKIVDEYIHQAVSVTYEALTGLIATSALRPGQLYKLTDYTCTTKALNTQSAGHTFDILIRATSTSALEENASACLHDDDTYFANNNLSAWKLKYCVTNDSVRFTWADPTNGKGVIYWMQDEFDNECFYDFKNIQFKGVVLFFNNDANFELNDFDEEAYYYTFSHGLLDSTVNDVEANVINNDIIPTRDSINYTLPYSFLFGTDIVSNTVEGYNVTITSSCYYNHISCKAYTVGITMSSNNEIQAGNNITLLSDSNNNTIIAGTYISLRSSNNNTISNGCKNIALSIGDNYNKFGEGCNDIYLGNYYEFNTFEEGANQISFSLDGTETNKVQNLYIENSVGGESPIDLNNSAITMTNLPYSIRYKRDSLGNYIMSWNKNKLITTGYYKTSTIGDTWHLIPSWLPKVATITILANNTTATYTFDFPIADSDIISLYPASGTELLFLNAGITTSIIDDIVTLNVSNPQTQDFNVKLLYQSGENI